MKKLLNNPKIKKVFSEIAETASLLQQKGWAERNAGNISINISELIPDISTLSQIKKHQIDEEHYSGLAHQLILLTTSGSRMREISRTPDEFICFLTFDEEGMGYILQGSTKNQAHVKPTSELLTHLAIHQMLVKDHRKEKAILHTHVNELIALTHIEVYNNEETLNHLLWSMHPESIMFNPKGVGLIPYALSGTKELAKLTIESLRNHPLIIWEKHGCMAIGERPLEAFDLIDIVSKSASIYFLCKSAGHTPEGISQEQIWEIREGIDRRQET